MRRVLRSLGLASEVVGPAGSSCCGRRGGAPGEAATVPDGELRGGREDGPHRAVYRLRPKARNVASPPNQPAATVQLI